MFQAEYLMPGIEGFSLDDPECKGLRIIPDIPVGIKGDDLRRNATKMDTSGRATKRSRLHGSGDFDGSVIALQRAPCVSAKYGTLS
jgi:hypothetical protein